MRILQGATVILMGLLTGAAGLVAAYLACYLLHGASNPMHTTLLHREVTATHRTTVLSLNSMVFHPAAAVGSVMLTAVAAGSSVSAAIVLGGVVCALAAPLYLPAPRAERDRAAAIAQASV
jgi:predicted MFS family arabinose efflux permease